MKKKLNKTTQVVRDAMKAVSKYVRAPKAVRDGLVTSAPLKSAYVKSMNINKIKLSKKEICNVPHFSQYHHIQTKWDSQSFSPGEVFRTGHDYKRYKAEFSFNDIDINLNISLAKTKKINKIVTNYLTEGYPQTVNLSLKIYDPHTKSILSVQAEGFITTMSNFEGQMGDNIQLIFRPSRLIIEQ